MPETNVALGPTRPARRRPPRTIVARGPNIRVQVQHGHLLIDDGPTNAPRTLRLHQTESPERLLIIGRSGYISLDALQWLTHTRTVLIHINPAGQLITTTANTGADLPALRRAQALAATGPAGIEISRYVLAHKITGQRDVLHSLPHDAAAAIEAIEVALAMTATASTIDELLTAESYAASVYWDAWTELPIPFTTAVRIPDHWRTFGQRASLITGAPRVATNPANAILNYLYALLESETVISCNATGLDPGIGIFHRDARARASLALDLMEAARPAVDAYVLAMLTQRTLNPREFAESRDGSCRLSTQLAQQLAAGTLDTWRMHTASTVEHAANTLAQHATSPVPIRTPVTGRKRRAAIEDRLPDRRQRRTSAEYPELPNTCRICGVALTDRRRRYCDLHRRDRFIDAGGKGRARAAQVLATLRAEQRDPAHGGRAAQLRGERNRAHQQAVKEWRGERPDPAVFAAEILPRLRHIPIAELTAATDLSEHYCSLIRLGKKTPHPRHWPALAHLSDPSRD